MPNTILINYSSKLKSSTETWHSIPIVMIKAILAINYITACKKWFNSNAQNKPHLYMFRKIHSQFPVFVWKFNLLSVTYILFIALLRMYDEWTLKSIFHELAVCIDFVCICITLHDIFFSFYASHKQTGED